MKTTSLMGLMLFFVLSAANVFAQDNLKEVHLTKLTLKKKEKKQFSDRDSAIVLYVDTLIMKDHSSLLFFGKKEVKIIAKYAEIGSNVVFSGQGAQNNASNFDLDMNFGKLGSLFVIARGQNAINGTRTYPNGDGGNVTLAYSSQGLTPQQTDKKAVNYLFVDVTPGGLSVNPTTDMNMIYSRIATSSPGLRGLPQGQIYSGSVGKEGKVIVTAK